MQRGFYFRTQSRGYPLDKAKTMNLGHLVKRDYNLYFLPKNAQTKLQIAWLIISKKLEYISFQEKQVSIAMVETRDFSFFGGEEGCHNVKIARNFSISSTTSLHSIAPQQVSYNCFLEIPSLQTDMMTMGKSIKVILKEPPKTCDSCKYLVPCWYHLIQSSFVFFSM